MIYLIYVLTQSIFFVAVVSKCNMLRPNIFLINKFVFTTLQPSERLFPFERYQMICCRTYLLWLYGYLKKQYDGWYTFNR